MLKNGITAFKVKVTTKGQNVVNVCPDDIFLTSEHFVTKPGMVVQHHKPKCHAENFVYYVQCQGHRKDLYNQNMTVSVVSSKLLVGLQPKV